MRIGYVVNPVAGKKKAVGWVPQIRETTEHRGHEVDVYITAGPGDAVERPPRQSGKAVMLWWPLEETGQ